MQEDIKFVIVVRKDLNMTCGKIATQVGHACSSVVHNHINDVYNWINYGNQKKSVLKVKSEKELIDLIRKARELKISSTIIRDAGKTQVEPNTLTCCGFGPDISQKIDKLTGHLKLL
ncbi:MAG TPA: aminoacyl-tRNA hydrolase [Candidatus Sulfopaludibacter sp.]|nr:aminoacyl-tRNA hydrolase [Candidatus Sulfopaludibacter sp.]